MRNHKVVALIVTIIALCSPGSLVPVSANDGNARPYIEGPKKIITLSDMGFEQDDTVSGVYTKRDYGFVWPDSWVPQDPSMFTLFLSHSPTVSSNSNVSISFNGGHLESFSLNPENNTNRELKMLIPSDKIVEGYNYVEISFYLGVDNFDCRDIDDGYIWATVHNTTKFSLAFSQKRFTTSFESFPQAFVDNSSFVDSSVYIIIPDESKNEVVLSAAATVAAKLGQTAGWRPLDITVLDVSETRDEEIVDEQIFIGRYDELPSELESIPFNFMSHAGSDDVSLVDELGNIMPSSTGILWMTQSPYDSSSLLLVVTGYTDEAVLKASRALADSEMVSTFFGPLYYILSAGESIAEDVQESQTVSFTSLGYNEVTTWGTKEQVSHFIFPYEESTSNDDVTLSLRYSHSPIIDFPESYITVLVNDTPVASARLSDKNSDDAEISVSLPVQLFRTGNNVLTVSTNMDTDYDNDDRYDCLEPAASAAWLVVDPSSNFVIPVKGDLPDTDLNHYPYRFTGGGDFGRMVFVVPKEMGKEVFVVVTKISEFFGHLSNSPSFLINVKTDDFQDHNEYDIEIVLGSYENNETIRFLHALFPKAFKLMGNGYNGNEYFSNDPDVGYIQTFTFNNIVYLVITGKNSAGIEHAGSVLTSEGASDLGGNLVFVYGDDEHTEGVLLSLDEQPGENTPETGQQVFIADVSGSSDKEAPARSSIVFWTIVIAFATVIIIALFVAVKHRRNQTDRAEVEQMVTNAYDDES